ncbi:MAG: PDZ domain-containing protein [Chloroflexi bacterium]|nr:PDZ domain-containing protein [Chloroflexota bacterium]MDA1174861.1 PDZ domain-containing protein [Chloroflexota bacterium]
MRVRRLVMALLAVVVLSGAMLSVVSAAPRTQELRETAKHERPAKAFLGLETTKLSPRIKQYLELPEEIVGLLVMGSIPGSPAAASGIVRADVVLSVDDLVIETPKHLERLLNAKAPGDVIQVNYVHDGVRATVSITLAALEDHKPPRQPAWLTQVRNFVRAFPNVVVGNLDVLGDDGIVRVHTITPAQIVAVDEANVTVVDRLDVTSTVVEGVVVVRGNHRIAIADLREGNHVVVLEIDGTLKAIVFTGAPRDDAGRVRGEDLEQMEPDLRGPIVSIFRTFMNGLREQFMNVRDSGNLQELILKLQERIAELQARMGSTSDSGEDAAA